MDSPQQELFTGITTQMQHPSTLVFHHLNKGLFGSVPLQFSKVEDIPLQFVYSESYHYNSHFV
jgi:hypothetical protein